MKPLGFAFSDIETIQKRVKCSFLKSIYEYKYTSDTIKKESTFIIIGKEFRSFVSGKKLLGRFLVIDTISNLKKLGCEFVDFQINGNNIEPIKDWKVEDCDSFRTKFKKIVVKQHFLNKLIKSRDGDQKVFKHTLQHLFHLYVDECKKKNIKPNKIEIVKALSGVTEFDLSNKALKKIFSMFISWRETNGGKRTLQAFHDICLNKTDFNKATYDNCADPFSLKILTSIWTDNKVEFPYFDEDILSKRVIRLRKKKKSKKLFIKKCVN